MWRSSICILLQLKAEAVTTTIVLEVFDLIKAEC